ncbi:DEAD/DEAH box helicase [Pseudonocardia sp. MCCB 268]|nr:DEAD/DEAH box helicase [Pseudonocardia cytotoxica]
MLAVTTSDLEPLPHQIQAVYGDLLAQHRPLRFLLADDPGAGKTIMAGLKGTDPVGRPGPVPDRRTRRTRRAVAR